MTKFEFGGPPRYRHQKLGLRRLIETRGVCALLFEPGLGKTATTLDYLSLLALKSDRIVDREPEVRVLVISPKAAVDTWVLQAETWTSPQVNIWAEALGGSITQKAETLISRGPSAYTPKVVTRSKDRAQARFRAINVDRAELLYSSGTAPLRGPGDLRGKPRIVMLSTNLDTFASRARKGSGTIADTLMAAVKRFEPDVIVIDELHKVKGHSSNTSRLMGRIGQLSARRVGLTGTVMPHSPMDVFGQWRFINPTAFGVLDHRTGERKRATFSGSNGFQHRFGVMGGFMGREVISYRNLDEMQAIMAQNSIVARKEDSLDLPDMTDTVVKIPLSSKEQGVYDQMKANLAATLGSGTTTAANRLTQMLRLRQITAGHMPDDQGAVQSVGSTKIDTIASIVHDTLEGEKRVVIFALFRHEVDSISAKLARKGTEVLTIDGRTSQEDRLAMRRRFGDLAGEPGRIILVAQIKTISVSVNELVSANHAIFASLSQQRDDLIQARDRLNRIGQTRPCTFWYVLAAGTVDEVIYRSHLARTSLEASILRHIQGKDTDEHLDQVANFT